MCLLLKQMHQLRLKFDTEQIVSTGGVRAEPRVWGISWGVLALEVGKPPTEVPPGRWLPVAPPSAISEFTSSSSPSWSLNRAVLEKGANMVSRTRERAIDLLLVLALLALWPRRQYVG